jgi:hypothetical protein
MMIAKSVPENGEFYLGNRHDYPVVVSSGDFSVFVSSRVPANVIDSRWEQVTGGIKQGNEIVATFMYLDHPRHQRELMSFSPQAGEQKIAFSEEGYWL